MCQHQSSASSLPSATVATNGTNRRYLNVPMSSHGNLYPNPGLSAMTSAIDVRAAIHADILDTAVGFGGDVDDAGRRGLTIDHDGAQDLFGGLGAHPDTRLL